MISAKRVFTGSRLRRAVFALSLMALPGAILPAVAGAVTPGPAWALAIYTSPTNFKPGDSSGTHIYNIVATNVGSQATAGTVTMTDVLPPGLSVNTSNSRITFVGGDEQEATYPCDVGPPVRCTFAGINVNPGQRLIMRVPVDIAADVPPVIINRATVSGGAPATSASARSVVSTAPAPFGIQSLNGSLLDAAGAGEARAGAHPYSFRVGAEFNTNNPGGLPAENPKNIVAELPAGLVVNPKATPVRCVEVQLETNRCPDSSAIGMVHLTLAVFGFASQGATFSQPLYNMVPPQGRPASFAFSVAGFGIDVHLLGHVRSDGSVGLGSDTLDIPQVEDVSGVSIEFWGDPSDPSHDFRRGECGFLGDAQCPVTATEIPLLTMPSACSGPLDISLTADSWQDSGDFVTATAQTKDPAGSAVDVNGCEKLDFSPKVETVLSTSRAGTGTGMDFTVDFPNDGFDSHTALTESNTEKAVVTLPEGVTINPSVGEGLGFCTPAQYDGEKTFSIEGEGCPADSKVGTVSVETPLLDERIDGAVYLAQQDDPTTAAPGAENPFDTDVALYMVLRNAVRGIFVKQELKVEPDPRTGQLVATLEDIPQLPFSHFNFHFREGARAALISPSACGRYTTVARFYPASNPTRPRTVTSDFEIESGVDGSPCPSGGVPPFDPTFSAGSINNNAKSYSPFNMRLQRADGEQDMTKFSSILPPGVLGKLAGVKQCPDAAIAAAKGKTGRQEKAAPSCPANSQIGRTIAGAGVGDSLTHVGGTLHLAGPYNGAPLSVVSITSALAGPFDAGTVVVRVALTLNPVTAEVEIDGAASDPIPHILKGIVLKVRDLRVLVDKENFILNPTSCDPSSAKATLFGSFLDVFSPSDDVAAPLATRYQAANCLNLGFKPKLSIKLNGGTRRGDHPALRAVVKARGADANIDGATVTLPRSAFLDQSHIRTICTRVQYAADACPAGARYGYARAFTPLLDEPVEGPVYLRSSNNKLPDLVASLHGIVDVDVVGRIDSFKGGIRSSFESLPDAPVSKFVLTMQGGKKGLVVNSRNLCKGKNRADARFVGQNGRRYDFKPLVKASCKGKSKRGRGRR